MSYLDRDGVSIYYEQRGAGPSVLLSHGYSASARMWQGQMDALSDSYHLIAWDMRGHDRSDSPDDPSLYSHDATIHDMAAVLDACGVGRAIIAGLSLGGFMSLAFHLAHPVSVARHRSAQGLAHAARGMLAQSDGRVIESLPAIAVPTLVLVGENDAQFRPSADYMAAKIPGAEKVILENAGHAANIDQPAAFNAAVRAFLDRVTA